MVTRPVVWLTYRAQERGDPAVVAGEVAEAIAEGRVACRLPRRLVRRGRRPRAECVSVRFAWTADFGRVFVIRRARSPQGESGVLVLSVFTPAGATFDDWRYVG